MSAFGGKADIGSHTLQCLLLTQSGHWRVNFAVTHNERLFCDLGGRWKLALVRAYVSRSGPTPFHAHTRKRCEVFLLLFWVRRQGRAVGSMAGGCTVSRGR